jgi:hypothetical protein
VPANHITQGCGDWQSSKEPYPGLRGVPREPDERLRPQWPKKMRLTSEDCRSVAELPSRMVRPDSST